MAVLTIFTDSERKEFDSIPKLNDDLRKEHFKLAIHDPDRGFFRKKEALVGYILLKGYFSCFGRFYQVAQFHDEDIVFVCQSLQIEYVAISKENYPETSYRRHKNYLSERYGITFFKDWRDRFLDETIELVNTVLRPKQIIYHLVELLRDNNVEIPSYYVFAETITHALNSFENDLGERLNSILTDNQKDSLEQLLTLPSNPEEDISPSNPYYLTTIKKPEQSETPQKIKESLKHFQDISDLYHEYSEVFQQLEVSDQLINYYAVWLIKSKHVTFLSITNPSKKYLYLLSFIIYQYRLRQDLFVDIFLKAIQKFKNDVEKSIAKDFLEQKPVRNKQTQKIINKVRSLVEQIDQMRSLTYSASHDDSEKIAQIKKSFEEWDQSKEARQNQKIQLENELKNLELSITSGLKDQMLLEKYVQRYRKLYNRVGGILPVLTFNINTSNPPILEAIDFIKSKKRSNLNNLPLNFLNDKDRKALTTLEEPNVLTVYKVFLYLEISNHIKAGSLNLSNSDRYRAVEDYLIPENIWNDQKAELMERAGVKLESSGERFIERMRRELDHQYNKTNNNASENKYLTFTTSGKPKVMTPKVENQETNGLLSLLEEKEIIALPRILAEINRSTLFLETFQHFSQKRFQKPPDQHVFFAAIIAIGCNLGIRRMSRISKGISLEKLNYLVQWYFSKDNLDKAIAKINGFINELSLPQVYKKRNEELHTSSDGQKFNVSVPSINATYSYKYFGSGKGVTAYSFIDDYSRLYYNTVISASEREAAYVIDGLMHNEEIESDIHSTDTHGFSEIVFAISNGLGVFFAPRIKNYKDQFLYTFKGSSKKDYERKRFIVTPTATKYIDENIVEQWESILRAIVTIKLRMTTASRVLKRLSSYSKLHPLYKALKQVGRIYKTIFILKYIDDVNLRQSAEKALNRIEQSHQFAKAISFGNNQELKQGTREDQEIAVASRHLIQNAIVLWNYLKISKVLVQAKSQDKFETILDTVQQSSIMTWQHINIHGEYDFDPTELNDLESSTFELEEILSLEIN